MEACLDASVLLYGCTPRVTFRIDRWCPARLRPRCMSVCAAHCMRAMGAAAENSCGYFLDCSFLRSSVPSNVPPTGASDTSSTVRSFDRTFHRMFHQLVHQIPFRLFHPSIERSIECSTNWCIRYLLDSSILRSNAPSNVPRAGASDTFPSFHRTFDHMFHRLAHRILPLHGHFRARENQLLFGFLEHADGERQGPVPI